MATAAPSDAPRASNPPVKLPSNPTPLSAPQEQQVRDLYYKNVRAKCADEIKGTWNYCISHHLDRYLPYSWMQTPKIRKLDNV